MAYEKALSTPTACPLETHGTQDFFRMLLEPCEIVLHETCCQRSVILNKGDHPMGPAVLVARNKLDLDGIWEKGKKSVCWTRGSDSFEMR